MLKDKRKSPRKPMRYSAWVSIADKLHGCALADISETGARLDVEDSGIIPESFVLFLSGRNGKARRYCRVMWRAPRQMGVQFEKKKPAMIEVPAAKSARAAARKKASASEPAEAEAAVA